jgi:hypothetical protein
MLVEETVSLAQYEELAKEVSLLRELLEQAGRARDDRMRETVEMNKQVMGLRRELKRLGWTGFAK